MMKKGNQQERRHMEQHLQMLVITKAGAWVSRLSLPTTPNFPLSLHSFNSFLILDKWSQKETRFVFVKTKFFFFIKLNLSWTLKELSHFIKVQKFSLIFLCTSTMGCRPSASLPHLSSRFCCSAHLSFTHSLTPGRSLILTRSPTDVIPSLKTFEMVPHFLQKKVLELFASPPLHGAYTSASLPGSTVSQNCTAPFYVESSAIHLLTA